MNEHDTILKLQAKFGEAFPVYDIRALSWKMKMEYFYEKGLPIKKGLKELVSYLKEMKIKIAVASSSSIKIINEYLQLSDLENQFDYIVGGDKVVHSKPDPEIFLKVLEHFNFYSLSLIHILHKIMELKIQSVLNLEYVLLLLYQ